MFKFKLASFILTVLVIFSVFSVYITSAGSTEEDGWVYWADFSDESIRRAHLDGSDMQILYSEAQGIENPKDVALDAENGYIYWTMGSSPSSNKIQRAPLDGSGPIETLIAPSFSVGHIELDVEGGKMYWTKSSTSGKLFRSNLDGSDIEELSGVLNAPTALTLDLSEDKIYWGLSPSISCLNEAKIQRSNLDGTNVEDVVTGLKVVRSLALDPASNKIYWGQECDSGIFSANLDDTGSVELLIHDISFGLEIDPVEEKLYWAAISITDPSAMMRSNLDGSDIETLLSLDVGSAPFGIELLLESTAPEDLNQDGVVDGTDLAILLGDWGTCPVRGVCEADLNDNGQVEGQDLAILLAAWS